MEHSVAGLCLKVLSYVRVADRMEIAQRFSAGMLRHMTIESAKRTTDNLLITEALRGSAVRFTDFALYAKRGRVAAKFTKARGARASIKPEGEASETPGPRQINETSPRSGRQPLTRILKCWEQFLGRARFSLAQPFTAGLAMDVRDRSPINGAFHGQPLSTEA